MKRIVVAGGNGFFGAAAVSQLRNAGLNPVIAGRRNSALMFDLDNAESMEKVLLPGDIVLDAAGPFQSRSTALIETAIKMRFDVVDIADSLVFAEKVVALEKRIEESRIRVLTGCSSVSVLTATFVRMSGIEKPLRVSTFLVPAGRTPARRASTRSLLESVGRPIRVLRKGMLVERQGWAESGSILLPVPFKRTFNGFLFETSDAIHLPRIWPSLQTVDSYVDTRIPGVNGLLSHAAWLARIAGPAGQIWSRLFGSKLGAFGADMEGPAGAHERHMVFGGPESHITPIVPAAMAAEDLANDRFPLRGLVPVDRQIEPIRLMAHLESLGIHHIRPA